MSNWFLQTSARLAAVEARLAGIVRHAPVAEVNAAEGWVRLDLGEGDSGPLLSPKVPYGQMAGALKVHAPPSVGQNMTMISPTGDPRQALALPMTWSGKNKSPGGGGENVISFGEVILTLSETTVVVEVGGFKLKISGEGLAMAGGKIGHNAKDIGATHTHGGIQPGGAQTAIPTPSGPTP